MYKKERKKEKPWGYHIRENQGKKRADPAFPASQPSRNRKTKPDISIAIAINNHQTSSSSKSPSYIKPPSQP
jgi:hypothetical protein